MSELQDFILENKIEILIIIGIVLTMLVIINIKGFDLNEPKPESKLVQQVTVETFLGQGLGQGLEPNVDPSCPNMYSGNFSEFPENSL
jgi:hypothetical protein